MAKRLAVPALLLAFIGASIEAHGTPYVPASNADVVAELPTAISPDARRAMGLHKLLARAPDSLELALQTAQKDMDVARAQSDPRFAGYAESALAPWWSQPDPPVQVLLLRATILQNRHDFDDALRDLTAVLKDRPDNGQAYLTRAVIRQVRGDFEGAADDCRALAKLTNGIAARACLDSVESVSGRAGGSFSDLRQTFEAQGAGGDRGVASWCLTLLAEMAGRLGEREEAEAFFKQALALGLRDGYMLGAYADFLLDARRPEEVIKLLGSQLRVDPLLLRVALAEKQTHAPALAGHVADLEQRFATARARGDMVHRREEARFTLFLLEKPADALRIAQANWAVQREPADAQIYLAAALAADPSAAQPVIDWIRQKHFEDVTCEALIEQIRKGRS